MGSQEYQGAKANGEDDYMCVKIKAEVRNYSTELDSGLPLSKNSSDFGLLLFQRSLLLQPTPTSQASPNPPVEFSP